VDFSLTDSGFGSLSASFYYPYMLLQIPAGLLILRFGSRRLLVAGLTLCIVASLITASSQNVGHVAIARVLMGLGATPSFVATMALVTRWFPSRHFPMLVAATETIGMLGAALGQEILGFVVQSTGWRTGMISSCTTLPTEPQRAPTRPAHARSASD
jgi:MFS family permease